ncbi:hypothetical protein ABQE62_11185 [Mycolicibacterium fortuitum]
MGGHATGSRPLHVSVTIYRASTAGHANPIGKAFKRVDNGGTDSVAYFYSVFAADIETERRGV